MFVTNMLADIRGGNSSVRHQSAGVDIVHQMLAYLAAEIGRWNSSQVRPVSVLNDVRNVNVMKSLEKLMRNWRKDVR